MWTEATFCPAGAASTLGRPSTERSLGLTKNCLPRGGSLCRLDDLFSYRTVSRLVKLMCPASPSTYRSFYVHLERIVPSTSAVQHARAVYAALPRSSLRLSTAPALLSSDGKSSSI